MCDKNTALTILQNVDERVRAELGDAVIKTYLYGSYARGDYNTESDVDSDSVSRRYSGEACTITR